METFYAFENDKVRCLLCPNRCLLNENQTGLCKVRLCQDHKIINPYSGILSASHQDPIEKKPLYHFHPGSLIFSVGFYGCTFHCKFCQNCTISQSVPPAGSESVSPQEFAEFCLKKSYRLVAFTYSEPTLYYEWIYETSKLLKKAGIKTVLVTNGYLESKPAENLFPYIDALNIDLKSSENSFYQKLCHGRIDPVKTFIQLAFEQKKHIEITTLVITGENDSLSECRKITEWIASLSDDIPFHISRYFPAYLMDNPPTDPSIIRNWITEASQRLHYVYGGNVPFGNDTLCRKCRTVLISRTGYQTGIKINRDSTCPVCHTYNPVIFS